jgi:hypothetical protein
LAGKLKSLEAVDMVTKEFKHLSLQGHSMSMMMKDWQKNTSIQQYFQD